MDSFKIRNVLDDLNKKKHLKSAELRDLQMKVSQIERTLENDLTKTLQEVQSFNQSIKIKTTEQQLAVDAMEKRQNEEMDKQSADLRALDMKKLSENATNQDLHSDVLNDYDVDLSSREIFDQKIKMAAVLGKEKVKDIKETFEKNAEKTYENEHNMEEELEQLRQEVKGKKNKISKKDVKAIDEALFRLQKEELMYSTKIQEIEEKIRLMQEDHLDDQEL